MAIYKDDEGSAVYVDKYICAGESCYHRSALKEQKAVIVDINEGEFFELWLVCRGFESRKLAEGLDLSIDQLKRAILTADCGDIPISNIEFEQVYACDWCDFRDENPSTHGECVRCKTSA